MIKKPVGLGLELSVGMEQAFPWGEGWGPLSRDSVAGGTLLVIAYCLGGQVPKVYFI